MCDKKLSDYDFLSFSYSHFFTVVTTVALAHVPPKPDPQTAGARKYEEKKRFETCSEKNASLHDIRNRLRAVERIRQKLNSKKNMKNIDLRIRNHEIEKKIIQYTCESVGR